MNSTKHKHVSYKLGIIELYSGRFDRLFSSTDIWGKVQLTLPVNRNVYYYDQHPASYELTFAYAMKVFDWLLENEKYSSQTGIYTGHPNDGGLGVLLHRVVSSPICTIPYVYRCPPHQPISTLTVNDCDQDAIDAGWHPASRLFSVAK